MADGRARSCDAPARQRRAAPAAQASRVALTPSGQRVSLDGEGPDVLELTEQGFYEVRAQEREARDRRSWPATSISPNRI